MWGSIIFSYAYLFTELRRLLGSARHATRKQAIENSLNELDSRSASLYRQHSALTSASPILEEKTEDGNSGLCTPPSKTLTRSHSDSLKPYKDHVCCAYVCYLKLFVCVCSVNPLCSVKQIPFHY